MNNVLILDVETTTSNKGNPFDQTNKLVCIGFKWLHENVSTIVWGKFESNQFLIDNADLIVGFNIKFDLHWLRKIGIDISNVKVWECQIAEFILNNQSTPYPSLDQAAEKYGFEKKLDIVKTEYWDKGIDTDQIPREILSEYLSQDLNLTEQVYLKQREQFQTDSRYPLFKLQCMDLLVLEEMEWNGIKFDTEAALKKAVELQQELDELNKKLIEIIGNIPFNLGSNDHVSAILYGGTITVDDRIPIGVYKSGAKVGHTRYKIIQKEYKLPRLVEPLKNTEVKKGGYWEVNETVLRKLKLTAHAKKVVALLRKHSELEKLRGTYLEGYPKLINKMNWPKDMLHGTLNQCVAVTGRLSSSKPNLQNVDPVTKLFMKSRYE